MILIADGEKIKALRLSRNWELADLAAAADVNEKNIYRAERSKRMQIKTLRAIASAFNLDVSEITAPVPVIAPPVPASSAGCSSLLSAIDKQGLWREVEDALIQVVNGAGLEVQRHYKHVAKQMYDSGRDPLLEKVVVPASQVGKNFPDIVDFEATKAACRVGVAMFRPLAERLGSVLSILAEEGVDSLHQEWLVSRVPEAKPFLRQRGELVSDPRSFVLVIDGLDASVNHRNMHWPYCSGAALLVGGEPRAAAILDPERDELYSAVIPGGACGSAPWARLWNKRTGDVTDLVELWKITPEHPIEDVTVNYHLTRSNSEALEDFLDKLPALVGACRSTQAWNCGLLAMAMVAARRLGGVVNNFVNIWDVAAGEVLVRACGGVVSRFDGCPVPYGSPDRTSLIAAAPAVWGRLQVILG
ncbi:MAG: helix-turn-helix domain-containing protein [Acidobacteria bacterium]|nr:helix-turn-helix domain-containing protein [Acidobacteriota bacterium]